MAAQDFLDCVRAAELAIAQLRAGSQQSLDGRAIATRPAIPPVFGAMNSPAQRRAIKIGVRRFKRWMVAEDFAGHFRVAMESRPMQWGRAMLPERIDG